MKDHTKLHVGRPNVGDLDAFQRRLREMFERRWFTNDGPLVREFEDRVADFVGVKHCVATCNATVALEIAGRALGLSGEVIVPAFTFVATAHAFQWMGLDPVFADIDPATHNINPASIERLITHRTSAIAGVHLWGRACESEAIEKIAKDRGLKVIYDAAHAFACSHHGRMIGGFGACEVFSFHATKFINSFEGGAVVTNDDQLAEKIRLMRNFGFDDIDHVASAGTNGKMTEVCAAMGLTSLDAIDDIIAVNQRNYALYCEQLAGIRGVSMLQFDERERNNYQYIVLEVERDVAGLSRDGLVAMLNEQGILARRYFWPGVDRMEPYVSGESSADDLTSTREVAARVIVLPTGQAVTPDDIMRIAGLIRGAVK